MSNGTDQILEPFTLPQTLLLGTATAATQIEGGNIDHSWARWARAGRTVDGSQTSPADDHWNRVDEDAAILVELGCRIYRMSVEWARIEPEPGVFDGEVLAHYRREIETLKAAGIEPLLTLHHFTNPLWFEDSGGWLRKDAPAIFERFARHVVEALADIVSDWVVINEPNVFALNGYLLAEWPPGHSKLGEYLKCARNMIRAHKRCYLMIHRIRNGLGFSGTMVGSAIHFRVFDPAGKGLLDLFASSAFAYLFHHAFVEGIVRGRFTLPLKRPHRREFPRMPGKLWSDFVGVNYYSRELIRFGLGGELLVGKRVLVPGVPRNDLGWEIYPEGLERVAGSVYRKYNLPVYVTENGTCDREDRFRTRYLYEHLAAVKRIIEAGVDLRRYYHWTLLDNFEWSEGVSARFGLVEVDFATQERRIRPSGRFFARVANDRGVTADCLSEFRSQLHHRGVHDATTTD
ncbi:MAG TPA: glycoside hydrolase family 1 protein [Spirochaetia bacterium]|nr:glycoside hydrolase family 1 protein [Spirochaetia bacterium]